MFVVVGDVVLVLGGCGCGWLLAGMIVSLLCLLVHGDSVAVIVVAVVVAVVAVAVAVVAVAVAVVAVVTRTDCKLS